MRNILFAMSDVYDSNTEVEWPNDMSEETIVGGLILNRIVGIAYEKIPFGRLNKENRKVLSVIKQYYENEYDCFVDKLKFVSGLLVNAAFDYAFLKGAFLNPFVYKRGQRISNDIDILVNSEDVCSIQDCFFKAGFIQGHCDESGHIIPASRREVVNSRLNNGETIPFLRYYNNELVEVDLNFSLDFKAYDSECNVSSMLKNTCEFRDGNMTIRTLSLTDFLIHLCCHLYKEASTYDWLINRRDLMLYKFCDINMFVHKYGDIKFFEKLYMKIIQYGVQKEIYYSLLFGAEIYPGLLNIPGYSKLLDYIKPESIEYLHEIVNPKEKKVYSYNHSFIEWFECANRVVQLTEKECYRNM